MRNLILSALGAAAIVLGWTLPAAAQDPVSKPRLERPVLGEPGTVGRSAAVAPATIQGDWAPGEAGAPRADAGKVLRVRLAAIGPIGVQVNLDQASVTETVPALAPAPRPTLLEWALILLGLTLAGAAAVISHRGWML